MKNLSENRHRTLCGEELGLEIRFLDRLEMVPEFLDRLPWARGGAKMATPVWLALFWGGQAIRSGGIATPP